MTLDELRERIKNELVLHEGNVADWQWARTGLPAEATELGITDFLRLVDDVSRQLNPQFGKILDLQTQIRKVAVDNQKKLSEVQIGGFALDAERMGLSRTFVSEQWVPHILTKIPDPPKEIPAKYSLPVETPMPDSVPVSGTSPVQPAAGTPAAGKSATSPPASSGGPPPGTLVETAETMQQKVRDILDDYKEHIPAPAIRALFRAINYDEKALADAVLAYLTANYYASEKEPQGNTLREKLTSTDWRHLVWWDRQAQPAKVPAPVPVQVSPAAVPGTSAPEASKSSGWRGFLLALAVAGGLIGFVVILVKSTGSSVEKDRERTQVEQTETSRTADRPKAKPTKSKKKRQTQTAKKQQSTVDKNNDTEATAAAPLSPRSEPYDDLRSDVGQYGERRARKDGQWGLWRQGKWMVLPVYDAIEVYKEGRARVTVNGNSYYIDRNGDRIR